MKISDDWTLVAIMTHKSYLVGNALSFKNYLFIMISPDGLWYLVSLQLVNDLGKYLKFLIGSICRESIFTETFFILS